MKFFHLSDLHIGRHLYHYNLKEDQEYVLGQVIEKARELRPDAILIAGDIYDKAIPSAEAVSIFDRFLTELSQIDPIIPIGIISGNHDSAERLDFAAQIFKKHHVYIAGTSPKRGEELLQRIQLVDSYGEIDIYLMPFIRPAHIRNLLKTEITSYEEAFEKLLEREVISEKNRNILVTHQFFVSASNPEPGGSELLAVGGIDRISIDKLKVFDYVAMGHIHRSQKVGKKQFRYCGTLIPYSIKEGTQKKTLTMVTLTEKGREPIIEEIPLKLLRNVREVHGTLEEVLNAASPENKEDYVSLILTDQNPSFMMKERLEEVYSNILEIRFDNNTIREIVGDCEKDLDSLEPYTVFCQFFRELNGREMTKEEDDMIQKVIHTASEELINEAD